MDSQQSLCVLPSNAPALQISSGSSGNLGLKNLELTSVVSKSTSRTRKRTPFTAESTQNHTAGTALQIRERRGRRQNAIPAKAELRSERYVTYRKKQRGGDKKAQAEQKWTDELEEVFQQALRKIPRTGRRLTPCSAAICGRNSTKPCGRNEHIHHFIQWHTGVIRCRKQISSHIQVLKDMQSENGEWMALVTKPDGNQQEGGYPRREMELPAGDENHPVLDQMPRGIIGSNVPYNRHSVCRIKFEMYVIDREGLKTLHTYSSLQSEIGSASRALEEVKNWRVAYPPLALYYDRGELDGELVLFDTSFSLLDNHPPHKSKLTIDFTIDIAQGVEYTNWECHTNFYENGILEESVSNPTNSNHLPGTNDARIVVLLHSSWWVKHFVKITTQKLLKEHRGDPHAIQQEAERARRYIQDISVVQEIWATPRASGSSSKRMAILLWNFNQTRDNEAATTTWRKVIPPTPPIEPYLPTRASTPCFIEPSLAIDTNLRHRDLLQPKPLHGQYFNSQSSLFAEDPETLFAGPDSRLSSLPSTPVADYRSFPSSTSTSFPSSISNETLTLEFSRDSAYGSQDSIFHSQDAAHTSQDFTLESQDLDCRPHHPSEDSVARSQDSAYHAGSHNGNQDHPSRDHYYHSQGLSHHSHLVEHLEYPFNSGSVLQHQPDENYYPSPDQTGPNTKATNEDFASINIQLSYSEAEDPQPSHIAPYIAPVVNMLPHQAHHDNIQDHGSSSSHHDHVRTPQTQEPFDMDQWRAVDQAVQWANSKFQSGDYEEVRDMMKHGQESEDIGEISDIERGVNVEMGLIESYGQGQDG